MIGMDFLGLINLVGENREKYVLLVVCYFIKMVFVKAYVLANLATVIDLWVNYLVPIFRWLERAYLDNGSYFTTVETYTLFKSYGLIVDHVPITYLQSVGLIKRCVQLVSA
jgi:hypothetical protein